MNHIKRLQKEVRVQRAELDALYQGLTELDVYLTSSKFQGDPTVQVQDVLNRIAALRSEARDVQLIAEATDAELVRNMEEQ